MSPKLRELYTLFDKLNAEFFNNKLLKVRILLEKRAKTYDGLYCCHYMHGLPDPKRLDEATITIHKDCWGGCGNPNTVLGTLLHEMIHQYQAEVLKRKCNHDAIFVSIAKRGERMYGVPVR